MNSKIFIGLYIEFKVYLGVNVFLNSEYLIVNYFFEFLMY